MRKQTKDVFVCSYALFDYQTNLNKPQYYLKDLVFCNKMGSDEIVIVTAFNKAVYFTNNTLNINTDEVPHTKPNKAPARTSVR